MEVVWYSSYPIPDQLHLPYTKVEHSGVGPIQTAFTGKRLIHIDYVNIKPKRPYMILLRGVSGSGKTSFAKQLINDGVADVMLSGDDYFLDYGGTYQYVRHQHKTYMEMCAKQCNAQLHNGMIPVIHNTNYSAFMMSHYGVIEKLGDFGIVIVTVVKNHTANSVHNIPKYTLDKQAREYLWFSNRNIYKQI